MYCRNCGLKFNEGQVYCANCGANNVDSQKTSVYNKPNNIIKRNEKGLRNTKFIFISSFICIVISFIIFAVKYNNLSSISGEEFYSKLTNNNYTVINMSGNYSEYSEANSYYIATNNEHAYEIIYLSGEESYISDIYQKLKAEYDELDEDEYYNSVMKIDNTLIFCNSTEDNRRYINDEFIELGYKVKIGIFGCLPAYSIFALIIIYFSSWMTIYEKANKKGIYFLIPIYNNYCECDIAFNQGILFLISLIPGISSIFKLVRRYFIGKKFNKSTIFCIGFAIVPLFFAPYIAYDESIYIK